MFELLGCWAGFVLLFVLSLIINYSGLQALATSAIHHARVGPIENTYNNLLKAKLPIVPIVPAARGSPQWFFTSQPPSATTFSSPPLLFSSFLLQTKQHGEPICFVHARRGGFVFPGPKNLRTW